MYHCVCQTDHSVSPGGGVHEGGLDPNHRVFASSARVFLLITEVILEVGLGCFREGANDGGAWREDRDGSFLEHLGLIPADSYGCECLSGDQMLVNSRHRGSRTIEGAESEGQC